MNSIKYYVSGIKGFTLAAFLVLILTTLYLLLYTYSFAQSPSPTSKPTATQRRLWALEDYLQNVSKFKNLTGEKQKKAYAEYSGWIKKAVDAGRECYKDKESQTKDQRDLCSTHIKNDYKKAKQFNRLLKYYLVDQKTPFICVKADLGIAKPLEARGISNPALFATSSTNAKETGRTAKSQVFLCTGEVGQKKLRVQGDNGRLYKLTPEDLKRTELQLSNIPPAGNLTQLEEKLGVDQ